MLVIAFLVFSLRYIKVKTRERNRMQIDPVFGPCSDHDLKIIDDMDILFIEAGKFIIEKDKASIGLLQRWFKIGFNRASKIMDQLAEAGVINCSNGSIKILMSLKEFEYLVENDYIICRECADVYSHNQNQVPEYNNSFDCMDGYDFELYCADLLKKNGYKNVSVTSSSGDYGADILAEKDNIKYAVQCKCYSCNVGVDAVYQISGGMRYYNSNIGVILTNRYFTRQAEALAQKIGVVLWDRDFLLKLSQSNYAKP